jgi:hypothetical protein
VRAAARVRQSGVDRYLVVQNALVLFSTAGRDVVQQHLLDLQRGSDRVTIRTRCNWQKDSATLQNIADMAVALESSSPRDSL